VKVPKAEFDKALNKPLRAPALPLTDIPKKRAPKRRKAKRPAR